MDVSELIFPSIIFATSSSYFSGVRLRNAFTGDRHRELCAQRSPASTAHMLSLGPYFPGQPHAIYGQSVIDIPLTISTSISAILSSMRSIGRTAKPRCAQIIERLRCTLVLIYIYIYFRWAAWANSLHKLYVGQQLLFLTVILEECEKIPREWFRSPCHLVARLCRLTWVWITSRIFKRTLLVLSLLLLLTFWFI